MWQAPGFRGAAPLPRGCGAEPRRSRNHSSGMGAGRQLLLTTTRELSCHRSQLSPAFLHWRSIPFSRGSKTRGRIALPLLQLTAQMLSGEETIPGRAKGQGSLHSQGSILNCPRQNHQTTSVNGHSLMQIKSKLVYLTGIRNKLNRTKTSMLLWGPKLT